ncbi:MAG: hypothetical protein EAZ85_12355, partial [Bacteroidetes bacterium]
STFVRNKKHLGTKHCHSSNQLIQNDKYRFVHTHNNFAFFIFLNRLKPIGKILFFVFPAFYAGILKYHLYRSCAKISKPFSDMYIKTNLNYL